MMRFWRSMPILFRTYTVTLVLAFVLLGILVALPCHGATYYVSPTGSNTSPYDTWAKAANLPSTAITAGNTDTGGDGPHNLYIAPGTYNQTGATALSFADADWTGGSVVFTASNSTTSACTTYGATVVTIDASSAYHGIYVGSATDNLTIRGRAIIRSGGSGSPLNLNSSSGSCDGLVISGLDFEQTTTNTSHTVYTQNVTATITNCTFKTYKTSAITVYSVRALTGSTLTFNYCIFSGSSYGGMSSEIRPQAGSTINLNNCLVLDARQHALSVQGGTITVKNSIIQGGTVPSDSYVIYIASGTANAYNNIWLPSGAANDPVGHIVYGSLSVDSSNTTGTAPRWKNPSNRGGYLVFRFDDYDGIAPIKSLAPMFAQYGFKGSFYISTCGFDTTGTLAQDIADLQEIITGGVFEVGLHGHSHTDLTYTNALTFSQTGGSNCTVAYDGTTITCNCDGADYDQTYTATGKTLGDIIAGLNGVKGWTVAKSVTGGQTTEHLSAYVKASSIATLTATAVPTDLLFNRTAYNAGFFNDEMYGAKALLKTYLNPSDTITDGQTGENWTCKTLGHPFNATSSAVRTIGISCGYTGIGSNLTTTPDSNVFDVDLYSIFSLSFTGGSGVTETEIRQKANAMAMLAAHSGSIVSILTHSPDSHATAPTVTQWGYALDEWSKWGNTLKITSLQLAARDIRASWTDDGDGTFSKTSVAYGADYNLSASSSLINAGTSAGLTSDRAGKSIKGLPDIGAYEFYGGAKLFGGGIKKLIGGLSR